MDAWKLLFELEFVVPPPFLTKKLDITPWHQLWVLILNILRKYTLLWGPMSGNVYINLLFYQLIGYVQQGNTHQSFHNIATVNDEAILTVAFWDLGL